MAFEGISGKLQGIFKKLTGRGKLIARAKWEALKGLPTVWKKRRQVQSEKQLSALRFARLLEWNPIAPLVKLRFR